MSETHTITTPEPELEIDDTIAEDKDKGLVPQSNVQVPLSLYEKENKIPYTAKFFQIDDFRKLDISNDIHNVRQSINEIESYVIEQIGKRDFQDTIESYEQIINEIFLRMSIEFNEHSLSKLLKTSKWVQLMNRNKSPEERKIELLERVNQ